MKKYVQARIDYYAYAEVSEKFNKSKQDAVESGKRLWTRTVHASLLPNLGLVANTMLASLSAMYDPGARRDAMLMSGLPRPIRYIYCDGHQLVGGSNPPVLKTKEWVVITGIFLACLIIYITLDMARPMRGFIRPDVEQGKIHWLIYFSHAPL